MAKYEIEASLDGYRFKHQAGWNDGDNTRFGVPMDLEHAVKEAQSFKRHHDTGYDGKRFKAVRLIVNI